MRREWAKRTTRGFAVARKGAGCGNRGEANERVGGKTRDVVTSVKEMRLDREDGEMSAAGRRPCRTLGRVEESRMA
jgi:hypothetical protein